MNNQEITQADNLTCPRCQLSHIKRNGHTYYGKQNYQCLRCRRQFVVKNETVSLDKRELIKALLLERISLCGICRVSELSLAWLLDFIERLYLSNPTDLNFVEPVAAEIKIFSLEADELWSFVKKRSTKRWIWLILERRTRQIIALHIGDRRQMSGCVIKTTKIFIVSAIKSMSGLHLYTDFTDFQLLFGKAMRPLRLKLSITRVR